MKHGILAHQQIDTSGTPVELYTFIGPAAYTLHSNSNLTFYVDGLLLPNPNQKHLANAGNVITVEGYGVALLEGIEQ